MYNVFVSGSSRLTGCYWCTSGDFQEYSDVSEFLDNVNRLYIIKRIDVKEA